MLRLFARKTSSPEPAQIVALLPQPASSPEGTTRLVRMMRDHFDAVWRSACRLGLDAGRAEDVAQRAFMIAADKLESIEIGKEKSCLLGVTTPLASDARKSVFHARGLSLDAPGAPLHRSRT